MYIVKDKSSADFIFQVLTTCGTKADVVKTAAINPIISYVSIIIQLFPNVIPDFEGMTTFLSYYIYNFTRYNNHFFRNASF